MKKTRIILFLLGMLDIGSQLHAQELLTIEQIIGITEKNFPGILMYQSRISSKEELAKGSKSLMPPTLAVGLDRFPYSFGKPEMEDNMQEEQREAAVMFMAEQMISNASKRTAKQKYLSSLTGIEQNELLWTKNKIRKEVKELYFKRYIAEKKTKVVEESDRLLELVIKTAEATYTNNQSSLSTIYKARARRQELNNMKLMLESDISESNIGLNYLMGRDINTSFSIDTLSDVPETKVADQNILLMRPDIASMESRIQSMELNKKLMGTASRPDFGLRLTHMQMLDMPSQWSLMGMVTIPIAPWSRGMYKSEVSSMNSEIDAMKQEKNAMLLMVNRMSAEKLVMLNNQKKQLMNYSVNIIPAYERNFETTLTSFKQNTTDYFILLDAWEMLLMKRIEKLDSEFKVLELSAEYEFETGVIK
jgi:outer membrane protein, heavy metal efflux system